MESLPSFARELDDIRIVANPAKAVALPPKGHALTAEDISLLESVDVRIAEEGGVTVVSVPIDTEEYVLEEHGGNEGRRRRPPCALPR